MNLLVHSAVAGAGLSMGRDVYRKTRDNIVFIALAAVALAGTAYGVWNMSRGHDRGAVGTFFRTFLYNAVIIAVSFAIFMFAFTAMAKDPQTKQVDSGVVMWAVGIQLALALCGLLVGLSQRPKRKEAIRVDRDNEQFLLSNGFRDVGGRDQTMLDPEGEELVLDDFRTDAIVFKVKGKRAVRAKIILDDTGRMVSYQPA